MVELRSMNLAEFDDLQTRAVAEYANERVAAGDWRVEEANHLARLAFNKLLPLGLQTPQNYLWTIVDPGLGRGMGSVWVQKRQRGAIQSAHALDLFVAPPFRRQGVAREAMLRVEDYLRTQDVDEMTLHVFDRNLAALALYEGLGYQANEAGMVKRIRQA